MSRSAALVLSLLLPLLLISGRACADAREQSLDKRVMALASELRCLVCQNQTLADSNAELALDMRNRIRAELAAGKSEQEVVDLLVARYGDFVLYRPPLKATTVLLWTGPFLLLALGVWLLARRVRRARQAPVALTPEERERAARLLDATRE
ncbi:MAG TPA: cytochrome c-type biogenesis protein [Burkholderiales bacterium]|nr:cytochrome c-type biogenesis protein [Burkholderiales bacterium]